MGIIKGIFLFTTVAVGLALPQLTPAAQWFLDNSSGLGNDSNSCTTRNAPCLTVAGVLAKSIQVGDLVAVRCSNTVFRETFIPPKYRVGLTIYDCQALPRPIFDCSDIISTGAWSATGGLTATYQASLPLEITDAGWVNVWENGAYLAYASATVGGACSSALVDATPGSYCPSSVSSTPITLYIHTSDGSNPAINGKSYTYSNRAYGYNSIAVTGATVYGIVTQNNSDKNGSLAIGPSGVAVNVTANNGSKHNVYAWNGNNVFYNVTTHNSYFGGQQNNAFVYNINVGAGQPVRFSHCAVTMDVKDSSIEGFFGHPNLSGSFGTIIYEFTTCSNVDSCLAGGSYSQLIGYNTTVSGVNTGGGVAGAAIINGMSGTMVISPILVFGGNIEISNITTTGSLYGIFVESSSVGLNLYVHDSTCNPQCVRDNGSTATSLLLRNNQVDNLNAKEILVFYGTPTIDSDFNTFTSTTLNLALNGTSGVSYTPTTWKALGYDLHSIF